MHMGKRVTFAPEAVMDDGLLDLVLVTQSSGLAILHANACARGGTHGALPFVETIRCKSYTLQPLSSSATNALVALNLDGELSGLAPFQATCVPRALEVFTSELRVEPFDTSAEIEPRLVLSLVDLLSPAFSGTERCSRMSGLQFDA